MKPIVTQKTLQRQNLARNKNAIHVFAYIPFISKATHSLLFIPSIVDNQITQHSLQQNALYCFQIFYVKISCNTEYLNMNPS
jgi:hypothetical protein